MNKQEKEKIKAARKVAALRLSKNILLGGIGCLVWTFTILLNIIIADDLNRGVQIFMQINTWLYQLYATLVGIGLFIFLIEHVIPKRRKQSPEIIIED